MQVTYKVIYSLKNENGSVSTAELKLLRQIEQPENMESLSFKESILNSINKNLESQHKGSRAIEILSVDLITNSPRSAEPKKGSKDLEKKELQTYYSILTKLISAFSKQGSTSVLLYSEGDSIILKADNGILISYNEKVTSNKPMSPEVQQYFESLIVSTILAIQSKVPYEVSKLAFKIVPTFTKGYTSKSAEKGCKDVYLQ